MNRILLFLFLFLTLSSQSQIPTTLSLDQYFQKAYHDWDIPGFSIGIIKDGEVVLSKGYGVLEKNKPAKADGETIYAIASNTKAFISTAIGILVDEGKLNWEDRVQKYLPYFELYDDFVSDHTTIRDLLCHRVGLGSYSGDVIWYKSEYTAEETSKRAAEVPQSYDFRGGYGYTNLMFIAAGEVIKKVSGKSWDQFVKDRFFEPLGMDRSRTSTDELPEMTNVATPHKYRDTDNEPISWTNWDNMGAAGGILSCTDDMLKWTQLHIDGGKVGDKQIYNPLLQEELWRPHNNYKVTRDSKKLYPSRHFSAYALGWSTFDYGGHQILNHGGGYDGMYSRVAIVPEAKLGIVILTNSMKGLSTWMMYHILDQYLGIENGIDWNIYGLGRQAGADKAWTSRIQKRKDSRMADTSPSLSLDDYTGLYRCKMYGDVEIKQENGKLRMIFPHAPKLNATLWHWHLDTYEINWDETHAWFDFGTVQFVLDNNGKVIRLNFDVPNDDIFFDEIKAIKVD